MKQVLTHKECSRSVFLIIGLLIITNLFLVSSCSTNTGTDLNDGPVPFDVLGSRLSVFENKKSCWFNYENIEDSLTATNEHLSRIELALATQTEFNNHISCVDTINVNFEQEFVLAGITNRHHELINIKEQELELRNDSLFYRVGIAEAFRQAPSFTWYIIRVKSRDYLEYPVVFDIYWTSPF